MRLSVVIVTHNSADVIGDCLDSVRSHLPDAEILVVDNASTDDTLARCEQFPAVRVLPGQGNEGYGRACNRGALAARGTHVLLLNPDVELVGVDDQALAREATVFPFGLVAPILQRRARARISVRPWWSEMLSHALGPLRPRELPVLPRLTIRRRAWWPAGALLLVAREEFHQVGGFDPRFFLYYEDQDLARRYRQSGLPIRMTAAVWARHQGGGSSTGDSATAAVLEAWSYLSWLEYLSVWKGAATARRAARETRRLRAHVDRGLAVVQRVPAASQRAARKRLQLAELERLVTWQSLGGEGTAAADFCPHARAIVRSL